MKHNDLDLLIGWYGTEVARLKFSGQRFTFDYDTGWTLPLESTRPPPGHLPAFLDSFLPLDMQGVGTPSMKAQFYSSHRRFIGNMSIAKDDRDLSRIPIDHLQGSLKSHADADRVYHRSAHGVGGISRSAMTQLDEVVQMKELTHCSGAQAKLPLHMADDGVLKLAEGVPSTHILKLPGLRSDALSIRGAVEWAGMSMVKRAGVRCSDFALIEVEGEYTPMLALLSERFDIPANDQDTRMIFAEEMKSAMATAIVTKINEVTAFLRVHSTNFREDGEQLFRQTLTSYLLENADFSARNLSLIKVASPTLNEFRSVRLAPAYDVMNTHHFAAPMPPGEREPMLMDYVTSSNRVMDSKLGEAELVDMGLSMGVTEEAARTIILQTAQGIVDQASEFLQRLPKILDRFEAQREAVIDVSKAAIIHCQEIVPDVKVRGPADRSAARRHRL